MYKKSNILEKVRICPQNKGGSWGHGGQKASLPGRIKVEEI
jgi:hypothetical protein